MEYTYVLGTYAARLVGSSPTWGTTNNKKPIGSNTISDAYE